MAIRYYERILAIRGQVEFSTTDNKYNPEILKNKLARNIEETKDFLKKIKYKPILKG